jgi:WD40 repeat protein
VTRQLIAAAFVMLGALSANGYSKGIARVQLPCESRYQDLSPSGTQLVVHCKDHSVRVVNVPEGSELRVFTPEQHANSFVYSHDGGWLAVGFDDGTVEVFPSQGTAPSKRWKPSARRIDTLYFFPDAKALVVGPVDSPAQVWDLSDTPTLRATLTFGFGGLNACAVSPDGKLLVAAGDDTVLRWYDTGTWKKKLENRGFLLETFALAFTLDGKHVLAGGADSRITVLDAATAKPLRQMPPEAGAYIVEIDLLGDRQSAVTVYFDNAGEKPPHQLVWDFTSEKSVALKSDAPLTCGGIIGGNLWVCNVDGKTVTLSQYE